MNVDLLRVTRNLLKTDVGLRHPLRVMARFGYLQLQRRLNETPFFFSTATGTRAFVDPRGDFSGITSLYYLTLPTLEELVFACHCLRPGEVFWDVGANQGFWSLLLAGRGAEAHAFEPAPVTFANQSRQFAAQVSPFRERLHGHNIAISSRIGKMRFTVDRGLGNFLLDDNATYPGKTIEVDITTVDALRERLPSPNLIKIDVEGWNLPVLQGALETLARPDLLGLVVETFRFADGAKPEMRATEASLERFGFRPFSYDPRARILRPLTELQQGRSDTIYVRDPDALADRLRAAPPVACDDEWF